MKEKTSKNVNLWFHKERSKKDLRSTIVKSNFEGIDIVSSYTQLGVKTLKQMQGESQSDFILRKKLKKLEPFLNKKYDYVFFDVNPSTSLITLNVFLSVKEIMVTVTPHKFSFSGIQRFFNDYQEICKQLKRTRN